MLGSYFVRYLHSNMVIFIINFRAFFCIPTKVFTFQYGYIYYRSRRPIRTRHRGIYIPIWLYLLCQLNKEGYKVFIYLHSNMVIFIMKKKEKKKKSIKRFTFQYGYIYYILLMKNNKKNKRIYIPIWLYLLYACDIYIPSFSFRFTFQYGYIYY